LIAQFGYAFCVLGIIGAYALLRRHHHIFNASAILFLMSGPFYCVLLTGLLFGEQLIEVDVYYLPAFVVFTIWGAHGLWETSLWLFMRLARKGHEARVAVRYIAVAGLLWFALLPLLQNYHPIDLSRNLITYRYGRNLLRTFERNAVFLGQGDYEFFSMAYLQIVEGLRQDITVLDINDLGRHDIYWKPAPQEVVHEWIEIRHLRPRVSCHG